MMATISALAVRLSLNAAGFSPAVATAGSSIATLGNTAVGATEKIRGMNEEVTKTEGILQRVTGAVKSHTAALLGIAGGGSVVAGIKAASAAENELYSHLQEHIGATETLSVLMQTLKDSVTDVYASFGKAFIESSNLKAGITEITNVITSLKPIAAGIGGVLGTLASWFVSVGRAILPAILAFKTFAFVVGVAFKITHALVLVGLVRWIAAFAGLRLGALAFQGAMLLVRAGYVVTTFAAAIFHAVSGPSGWAILAASVAVTAAAIYGIKRAYDAAAEGAKEIQSADAIGETTDGIDKLTAATDAAKVAAEQMASAYQLGLRPVIDAFTDVRRELNTLGASDATKKIYDLERKLLTSNREAGISQHLTEEQTAALEYLQTRMDELEVGKAMLKISQEIATIEKDAAQASLSKGEKLLDNLAQLGATQAQLAESKLATDRIDAIELAKKNASQATGLADAARRSLEKKSPFEAYKRELADIQRLVQAGAFQDKASATLATNAAGKRLFDAVSGKESFKVESPKFLQKGSAEAELAADRVKTPIEKLTEIEKQQLQAARDLAGLTRDQIAAIKNNQPMVANF